MLDEEEHQSDNGIESIQLDDFDERIDNFIIDNHEKTGFGKANGKKDIAAILIP